MPRYNHVETLHVYRVNRSGPRGHMLVTHWLKNALLRNLPGEWKLASGIYTGIVFYVVIL